jgi:4-hydroxymandelate oxidase
MTECELSRVGVLDQALSIFDLEAMAHERVSHGAWERISGGAADEITLRWNREAYDRIRLRPRVLVDVSHVDTRIDLLGQQLPFPILLAPVGAQSFVHPDGDLASVRGAGAAHATLVISSSASHRVEDVAKAATGPVWFQLYVQRDRAFTRDLVQRAEAAGCRALCVTVDSPNHGPRNREERARGELPERELPNLKGKDYLDPSMTWKDLAWLLSFARIRRGTDVVKALALGANAVLIGRPYLYGLGVAGADGVARVVEILRHELELAMALCGRPTIASIDASVLWPGLSHG